ncbi:Metallo-dependent phosphatase-like protein [Immersiella caudata]|uniref:Metallo-dependent phosphatase-like protein n=1 Tax=Immersiella caudata TaxID=314043 RepID=A0AA39XGG0_9PEZI|nr:Metallo-dependent phosphatase-like protein [Immersiella caudata]
MGLPLALAARLVLCGVANLIGGALAMQPSAVMPEQQPLRNLDWGKLNFLQTTDTHGWLGGHLTEPSYSADWGDYVSFAQHMRRMADEKGVDLLLVDAGDRVEGNGLYDSSTPKGLYLYDIYRQQDIDIICPGNHELYKGYAVDGEHDHTVPNYQNNYIASNVDYVNSTTRVREPLAPRYRKFKTKNQGIEVVAFGFLFNFREANITNSLVQTVEDTVKEEWFQQAIREDPDVFVVNGHVGVEMSEFNNTLYRAIRDVNPETPIVFLGGHVHVRNATMYDERAIAVASGRYFETIGWVSMDGPLKREKTPSPRPHDTGKITFSRRYIDTNVLGFYHHTGLTKETFDTERGKNTTAMITAAREAMDLEEFFGCAPQSYWMTRYPYGDKNNIYTFLEQELLAEIAVFKERVDVPRLVLINTGALRFDIFEGRFTRDSMVNMCPFTNGWVYIPDMPYADAKHVADVLLHWEDWFPDQSRQYLMLLGIPTCELNARRETFIAPRDAMKLSGRAAGQVQLSGSDYKILPGHTTVDGMGSDGDDTIHETYSYYTPPSVVTTEVGIQERETPEKVDFVFISFMKKHVLSVFKNLNSTYGEDDMKDYGEYKLDGGIYDWVRMHWSQDC